MAEHIRTGQKGERLAQNYLKRHRYQIIASNWRFKRAEIDIITEKNGILIFVEVKTRTNTSFGTPEKFISEQKMDFILEAASQYMLSTGYNGEVRFDVIAVILSGRSDHKLVHYKDAFFGEW